MAELLSRPGRCTLFCIVIGEHPSTLGLIIPVGGLTAAEAASYQSVTIVPLFVTNRTLISFRPW